MKTNASQPHRGVIKSSVDPTHCGSRVKASLEKSLTRQWIKAGTSTGDAR